MSQAKKSVLSSLQIENAIDELIAQNSVVLTVEDVACHCKLSDSEQAESAHRIVREMNCHEALLTIQPGQSFAVAGKLFKNAEFLVVPSSFEIENNILVPGHRFVPFMDSELFPSDVTLRESGARRKQSAREIAAPAEELIKYHLLLGAETLFDFFAAENADNIDTAQESSNPTLKLTVLDMKKFYAETAFAEGDALLIRVKDYRNGEFEFSLYNGKTRHPQQLQAYQLKFEKSLEDITEKYLPGAAVIDQLQVLFAQTPELLKNPAMSLDELLMSDSAFDIAMDQDGSTLVKRMEDDPLEDHHHHDHDCGCGCHHDHELPDNITIGSGQTGSLESMLAKLYPMLNMVELDAILLDNLKNYDLDFNSFYARAFGENALPFADGMQEACFFNELEERFEAMTESYPREYDQECGSIRAMIVNFTMERCTVLAELADLAGELEVKPELFEALAEVVLLLDEALRIANNPAAIAEDFDFAEFRTGVENALESGEEALSALRGILDGDD